MSGVLLARFNTSFLIESPSFSSHLLLGFPLVLILERHILIVSPIIDIYRFVVCNHPKSKSVSAF